jgi:Family of unknown function (DUF5681)
MRFVKGQSGNPAGRRPGSRNKVTQLVEEILEGGAEQATRELLNHACLGKATAMRICFDQLLPRRRGRPVPISLPQVETLADVAKWKVAILNGIADGEITPEEAVELMKVVGNIGRGPQAAEIDARVARLEQAVGALLGSKAEIPEDALASATNLQAQARADGPTAEAAARPADPDRTTEPPPAFAGNLQADRVAAPPESTAPGDAPLASARNLQADRAADGATRLSEPATRQDAGIASATNLQADRAAAGTIPPRQSAARPDASLASATNLQADRPADSPTQTRPAGDHAEPPPRGAAADRPGWREAA